MEKVSSSLFSMLRCATLRQLMSWIWWLCDDTSIVFSVAFVMLAYWRHRCINHPYSLWIWSYIYLGINLTIWQCNRDTVASAHAKYYLRSLLQNWIIRTKVHNWWQSTEKHAAIWMQPITNTNTHIQRLPCAKHSLWKSSAQHSRAHSATQRHYIMI